MEEAWELAVVSEDHDTKIEKVMFSVSEDEIADSYRKKRRYLLLTAMMMVAMSSILFSLSEFGQFSDLYRELFFVNGSASVLRITSVLLGAFGVALTLIASLAAVRSEASSDKEIAKQVERTSNKKNDGFNTAFVTDSDGYNGMLSWSENSAGKIDESSLSLLGMNESIPTNWDAVLHKSKLRLLEETDRLGRRSTVNLSAGVVFSAVAVIVLVMFTVASSGFEISSWSNNKLLSYFGPRISLVLIIQVLASFFLRMYVGNERDISKNKNEITNIELRAASAFMMKENGSGLDDIARLLGMEDRNTNFDFKIPKGVSKSMTSSTELLKQVKSLVSEIKP